MTQNLVNRIESLIKNLKKNDVDVESTPGLSRANKSGYKNQGKLPSFATLEGLARDFNVNLNWLVFGEGEMFRTEQAVPQPTPPALGLTPPMPVLGLATCGVEGLEQIMPYTITASPIALGPRSFAVVASGESMVPAGIASGHTCFCDPDQTALPGEAVFLRRKDNLGALKIFLGRAERVGFTNFRGWLALKNQHGNQKAFTLAVADEIIDCIAPVVCIRRRG